MIDWLKCTEVELQVLGDDRIAARRQAI